MAEEFYINYDKFNHKTLLANLHKFINLKPYNKNLSSRQRSP